MRSAPLWRMLAGAGLVLLSCGTPPESSPPAAPVAASPAAGESSATAAIQEDAAETENPAAGPAEPHGAAPAEPAEPGDDPAAAGRMPAASLEARTLSRSEIAHLKATTVFIKRGQTTGSGFVFRVPGHPPLVATNHHVVGGTLRPGLRATVEIVLDSGSGREQTLEAQVAGYDKVSDLAVLTVPALPADRPVLELGDVAGLFETQPLVVVGFPFGEMLAPGAGSPEAGFPAPTISTGTISSLRYNRSGGLQQVQLDADLNPGNSGGPVLDYGGRVIGVAVATVLTTDISFMVPVERLKNLLAGFVSQERHELERRGEMLVGEMVFEVQDPLGKIRRVGVNTLPRGVEVPREAQLWPYREIGRQAAATAAGGPRVVLRLRLPAPDSGSQWLQAWYENDRGRQVLEPRMTHVTERRTVGGHHPVVAPRGAERPTPPPEPPHDWGPPTDGDAEDWRSRVRLTADRVVREAPGRIDSLRVAGGGRYIVCRLGALSSVAVFDLASLEFGARQLHLAGGRFRLAAGGRTLVVYLSDPELFQVYDVESLELLKSAQNPFEEPINLIEMGHANGRRLLVRWGERDRRLALIDLADMVPVTFESDPNCRAWMNSDILLRTNGDLSRFTISGSRVASYVFAGRRVECELRRGDATPALFSDLGHVYWPRAVESRHWEPLLSFPDSSLELYQSRLFPAVGGSLFLHLYQRQSGDRPRLDVYEATGQRRLAEWPLELEGLLGHVRRYQNRDRRLVFLPWAGVLVVAPPGESRLELHRFDLDALTAAAGDGYLALTSVPPAAARPGEAFSYRVTARSSRGSVEQRLESGPPGMQLADGELRWQVPADHAAEVEVAVRLSDAGETIRHAFTLGALPPAPPPAAPATAGEPAVVVAEERPEPPPPPPASLAEVERQVAESLDARPLSRAAGDRIKAATVYVTAFGPSATGFLFHRSSAGHMLVTSYRSVAPSLPPQPGRIRILDHLTEQTFTAGVVALDPDNDLAVLRVEGLDADRPILLLGSDGALFETQSVLVAGFPFGLELASSAFTSPSLVPGAVSSLHYDGERQLERIQLDADLNPGLAGAPVLDAGGRVIGVAVGGVETTNVSFAVPIRRLRALLLGVATGVAAESVRLPGELLVSATFAIEDPWGGLRRVGLSILSGKPADSDRQPPYRGLGRDLAGVPAAGPRTTARVRLPIPLWRELWLQGWYENSGGRSYLAPFKVDPGSAKTFSELAAQTHARQRTVSVDWGPRRDVDPASWRSRVRLDEERQRFRAPGPIDDLRVAGAGRYLACRIGERRSVAVFDLVELDFRAEHRFAEDDFLYAAGGRTLAVYLPAARVFEVYDLERGKRLRRVASPFGEQPIHDLEMGHANSRRALVRWGEKSGWALLDLEELIPVELNLGAARGRAGRGSLGTCPDWSPSQQPHLRVNGDLSAFATPFPFMTTYRVTGRRIRCRAQPTAAGRARLTDLGQVLSSQGAVYDLDWKRQWSHGGRSQMLYPAVDGSLYLRVFRPREPGPLLVAVHDAVSHRHLAGWSIAEEWWASEGALANLETDRRIVFLPWAGVLAAAPPGEDFLQLHRFDPARLGALTGGYLVLTSVPPPVVRPGEAFEQRLAARSSHGAVVWELVSGPEGLRLTAEGLLRWQVPSDRPPPVEVLVRAADGGGHELFYPFTMTAE